MILNGFSISLNDHKAKVGDFLNDTGLSEIAEGVS